MFEFEPELTIPDKCRDCGVQCELGKQLLMMATMRHMTGMAAEELVGDAGVRFDAMIDGTFPEQQAEQVKTMFRKSTGDSLEEIDQTIDNCRDEINANALSCSGVLKMRATRGDVTYTVAACTSQRVYERDGEKATHLPLHVRADSAKHPR